MEDIEEEGDGGRKPARRAREEVRRARCEKQNLDPPLPHNVKKNMLTIAEAVNRQLVTTEEAQELARAEHVAMWVESPVPDGGRRLLAS